MLKYVISITRSTDQIQKARDAGYITTRELQEYTDLSFRRLYYWEACAVFGAPVNSGSGHSLMWHESIIPILRVLEELALEFGEFNSMSTDLLRHIVIKFNQGGMQLTRSVRLEWDTAEEYARFRRDHPSNVIRMERQYVDRG